MITNVKPSVHPAAQILPEMSEADYERLKADIAKNGLREPIWLHREQILDGRHRHRACLELDIQPAFREYAGDDPVGFVLSLNLHRRHLNASQRGMIAAKLADMSRGGDRRKAQFCALSHDQAAERLNISARLVDTASALAHKASAGETIPEVLDLVRDGALRLARAQQVAKLPIEQQREIIRDMNRTVTGKAMPKRRQQWDQRIANLSAGLERLWHRLERLAHDAEKAGVLTPGVRNRLIEAWREGEQRCAGEVRRLRESGVSAGCDKAASARHDQKVDTEAPAQRAFGLPLEDV